MKLKDVPEAIKDAIRRSGSQMSLAKSSGVSQGQISDYLCGRRKIENMTLGTFIKLFPDSEVKYFKDMHGRPDEGGSIERQVISILRALSTDDQAFALAMMAANFGENIRKETKQF